MNFSAEKARRKWACGSLACGERPMVTVLAVLLMLCALAEPAAAARKPAGWSQRPWGDLFRERRPKLRRAALSPSVPLPRPRPADAPIREPEKPAAGKQAPSETEKPVEQAAPAPPPPSACRLALTEEVAIAPSIPDIHGAGGCGGDDLVRLEAVVLPDKHRVSLKPAAILRCPMASAIADWVRSDIAPLAASVGSAISELDNFDSFECRGRNGVVGAKLSEHGRANALDVRAFKLANGQSISLIDRTVARGLRESMLHSACARFTTVLGPGSDWYHEDHIHLDLIERRNNYKICQWDVWDPLPQIAPLLPPERPDEAPARQVAAKSDADKSESAKSESAKSDAVKSDPAERGAGASKPSTKKRRQNRRF
ncbi:MAG: extensin family protein [Bradyrhizobium sp.]